MELLMDDENLDDIDAKPKRSIKLGAILGGTAPLLLIIVTLVYISIFQKDAVDRFLKKYDIIGVTGAGQDEKSRLYTINNLPIPFEQRETLKNGQIFIGATKEMIRLAVGEPAKKPTIDASGQEKWVYFFSENSRPTYLYFENDKLVNAAKGTTLDSAEIQ